MTKIYLAGPRHGYEDHNQPAFDEASAELRAQGFDVFYSEPDAFLESPRHTMHEDLRYICLEADGVVFLHGYGDSKGCTIELHLADYLGIPAYSWDFLKARGLRLSDVLMEYGDLAIAALDEPRQTHPCDCPPDG